MIEMLLVQAIGAIGHISLALSYYKKEKNRILFMQIIAYVFFTIHFYLLGGITGVICNFIGLLALIVIYFFDKYKLKHKSLVAIFFVLLLLTINIFTFQNIFSIFPMIASTIIILSFLKDDENFIRIIGIVTAICWLIYAIVYNSYITIVFQSFTLFNIFNSLLKNKKSKLSHKPENNENKRVE